MTRIEPVTSSLRGSHVRSARKSKVTNTKHSVQKNEVVATRSSNTHASNVIPFRRTDDRFEKKLSEFKELINDLFTVNQLGALASWDMVTYMPPRGDNSRARQLKNISGMYHQIITSRKMAGLLEYLERKPVFKMLSAVDKVIVEDVREDHDRNKKLPSTLVEEIAEVTAKAHNAWVDAREKSDFSIFMPHLEKIVELKRKEAEHLKYDDSPYDALVSDYEPSVTTKDLDKLFSKLKKELIPLIKIIKSSHVKVDTSFFEKSYSHDKQMKLSNDLLKYIGFNIDSVRIDESPHPCCTFVGQGDVRITTRIFEDNMWSAISSALHEGGHGLYASGYNPDLADTYLADSPSMGIDESQSRLYETVVGQGLPFWIHYYPKLQEQFPEQLKNVSLEDFYRAINLVKPSFIRIDADEVTYQMHIIMRYEIEKALIEGKLEVKDVPGVWNKKMEEYLGVKPSNDSEGCLQDMHWSEGLFGYFPTYTIGNIIAAQLYNAAKNEMPDLEEKIMFGDMGKLREWLREKIHKHGSMLSTGELVKNATGEDINSKYFISYIKEKYSRLYSLKL